MKNKLFQYTLISMLALTMASCGKNNDSTNPSSSNSSTTPTTSNSTSEDNSNDSNDSSFEFPSYTPSGSVQPGVDDLDSIPDEVKEYQGNIDLLVYIQGTGSSNVDSDIGSSNHTAKDINYHEKARFYAAARAFKKIAPGVNVNLYYCDIDAYDDFLIRYKEQQGHYPHLMWSTKHVVEMVQQGIYTDLTKYQDTEYYESFNRYFMTRFNYGGFQGAIPVSAEPWGVFVNLDTLDQYNVVNTKDTVTYEDWVDNFTWDSLLEAASDTYEAGKHAGISTIVDHLVSYAAPTIYDQFLREGKVSLNNEDVKNLLTLENNLTEYSCWDYTQGYTSNLQTKEGFNDVHTWSGTKNFVEDKSYTFYAEAPWALPNISQYITTHDLTTRVDYLPYPRVKNTADDTYYDAYTGIAVEGIGVGNLCPIIGGSETCYSTKAKLEEEVAAYFAMFLSADIRSIQERANLEYIYNDQTYVGSVSLPLIQKNYTFSWQDDPESKYPNPLDGTDYDDNWEYQMGLWFDVYNAYITETTTDESGKVVKAKADVKNFTNVTYGLTKILNSIYGDNITCLNYYNEPFEIPDGATTKNVWKDWQERYSTVDNSLGSPTYVAAVSALLADWEEDINNGTETAWNLIQEMLDSWYGEGYDVSPEGRANRNDYRN